MRMSNYDSSCLMEFAKKKDLGTVLISRTIFHVCLS